MSEAVAVATARPDAFAAWCAAADAVRATTKRLEKGAIVEAYLRTLDEAALAPAARFLSGIVFPRHDMRTTRVGGAILRDALHAITGVPTDELREGYVRLGDVGDLAGELFADRPPSDVTVGDIAAWADRLADTPGTTARGRLVREMLARLGGAEARYAVKLVGGELRIGLKESQVEEALARAFARPLPAVRRANLLRGDVGEVACLARAGRLDEARLALFHPIGFMLAQPLATPEEIVAALPAPFAVEDKYDGIRAQAHVSAARVALFSRTLDEITHGYPDVVAALAPLGAVAGPGLVLDGELLAVDPARPGRALPFTALQRRLGRKSPDAELLAAVPAAFVAYDVVAADGALVVDEPYAARRARLERLPWPGPSARGAAWAAPARMASTAEELEAAFAAARAAGNEGIILKDPSSAYTPGRRGKTWVKLKRAADTLDVVVTGVERGHGRRRHVLSDYTFAVRRSEEDGTLLNVGKAYSGLTDAEILALTERFETLTTSRHGRYQAVRPEVVLEVTFDVVQPSTRHKAGFALRFPRILRVRDDKRPEEVDTLERVRELAANGGGGGGGDGDAKTDG